MSSQANSLPVESYTKYQLMALHIHTKNHQHPPEFVSRSGQQNLIPLQAMQDLSTEFKPSPVKHVHHIHILWHKNAANQGISGSGNGMAPNGTKPLPCLINNLHSNVGKITTQHCRTPKHYKLYA